MKIKVTSNKIAKLMSSSERKPEIEVNPECIQGQEYRVPFIIKNGKFFTFENFHLPIGWQEAFPLLAQTDVQCLQEIFAKYCANRYHTEGRLSYDPETKILTEAVIGKKGSYSTVRLLPTGTYEAKSTTKAEKAIDLSYVVARHLSLINYGLDNNESYPYVYETRNGNQALRYGSANLNLPPELLEASERIIDEEEQELLINSMLNILKDMGVSTREFYIGFRDNGVLNHIGVSRILGSDYSLDNKMFKNSYVPHNVYTPQQAIALHACVASYINYLLGKKQRN